MAITDKTRKLLWGRSGNLCAICRHELVMDATNSDNEAIVGDECHIVAREVNGPRGTDPLTGDRRDDYENLILLCRIHHKIVDDQPNTYTTDDLRARKLAHENWVRESLNRISGKPLNDPHMPFLARRITTGQQFSRVVAGCHGFHFENDTPNSKEDVLLLGNLAQSVEDIVDIWDSLEAKQRIEYEYDFSVQLQDLSEAGFLVFGCQRQEQRKLLREIETWNITYVLAMRKTNPRVKRKSEELEELVQSPESTRDDFTNFMFISVET